MRKNIINMAAIGVFTLALTACGNAASNQPEAKAEKTVTEIPADSRALTKALNLKDTQVPLLNNPVGNMK